MMRIPYNPPSEGEFDNIFAFSTRGSGLQDIRVYHPGNRGRGGGIFSLLGNIARSAYPILKRLLIPELGNIAKGISEDISTGLPLRQSFKNNIRRSGKNIINRVLHIKTAKQNLPFCFGDSLKTVVSCFFFGHGNM